MSNKTLQQKYQEKKLQETIVRARKAARVLKENRPDHHANLLIEALEQDDLDKASEVIDKLRTLEKTADKFKLTSLSTALKTAQDEVNKYTGGGTASRGWQKIKSFFSKDKGSNPVLKSLALASALERGFKQIPAVLKNNIKDLEKVKDKPIQEILGTDEKTRKTISDTLLKAFVPDGIYGKIFSKIPYFENSKAFVQELMMNATPKALAELVKVDQAGQSANELGAEVKQDAQETKSGEGDKEKSSAPLDDKKIAAAPEDPKQAKAQAEKAKDNAENANLKGKAPAALKQIRKQFNFQPGSFGDQYLLPALQDTAKRQGVGEEMSGFLVGIAVGQLGIKGLRPEIVQKVKEVQSQKSKK